MNRRPLESQNRPRFDIGLFLFFRVVYPILDVRRYRPLLRPL
jgi:hypothetical protein